MDDAITTARNILNAAVPAVQKLYMYGSTISLLGCTGVLTYAFVLYLNENDLPPQLPEPTMANIDVIGVARLFISSQIGFGICNTIIQVPLE